MWRKPLVSLDDYDVDDEGDDVVEK